MSLFFAELRKVWGGRVFPVLLAILASANLCCCGWHPPHRQPAARRSLSCRRRAARRPDNGRKGAYLHGKYTEIESLVKIGGFYRDMAYAGSSYLQAYRDENAAMFDAYEQEYKDKSYTLFTDD